MNKIEQELGKIITQSRKDIPVIEDVCSTLTKHCMGFGEWISNNDFHFKQDKMIVQDMMGNVTTIPYDLWFKYGTNTNGLTTKKLFEQYINQL